MKSDKDMTSRRKSIAVPNQNKPAVLPRAKRRPHSIVPGDRLSPFAKARRLQVPRKSILKAFTNILHTDDDSLGSQPQIQSQTISQFRSQPSSLEDTNNTQSIDITNDFYTVAYDNTRKSLGGRRVSFARNVEVRVIEGPNNSKGNSTQSPHTVSPQEPPSHIPTDENAYPGAMLNNRRRSSARHSLAYSEDMDLTTVQPNTLLPIGGSAIADEDINYEEDDSMDLTQVINGDFLRKRSLSMNARQLSQVTSAADQKQITPSGPDQSQSFEEDGSQLHSDIDPDQSQAMDFTVPLGRPLRPPAQHDEIWLALRQATHSGDTPIEPEPSSDDSEINVSHNDDGMNLDDAVRRLMHARNSLPSASTSHNNEGTNAYGEYDETFSSTDRSFEGEGEQTMNISEIVGRANLDRTGAPRLSMEYQESTMDESEIYGAIVVPSQSAPQQSPPQPPLQVTKVVPTVSTVFQPPSPNPLSNTQPALSAPPRHPQSNISVSFSFTPKAPKSSDIPAPKLPSSPSKIRIANSITQPDSPAPHSGTNETNGISLNKRSRPTADDWHDHVDSDRPSPAKRITVASPSTSNSRTTPSRSLKPKPLSPSKKAPFQASSSSAQRPSSLRRPSGYFAQRKSLGTALEPKAPGENSGQSLVGGSSKNVNIGRASMGSSSAIMRSPFRKTDGSDKTKGKQKETHEVSRPVPNPISTTGLPGPGPSQTPTVFSSPVQSVADTSKPSEPEDYGNNYSKKDIGTDFTEQSKSPELDDLREADEPPISIQQFFSMTGIKFMDELTAPRRSIHAPQQDVHQARNPEEIPLAEYVSAIGIDVPQLVLYSRVSKDLQAWIEKSKADFVQAEDEATKITPELFTEYSKADEEGQAELFHQLQLIRTNTRALAKSDWYDWKLQWLEGLRVTADKTFKSLEEDAIALDTIRVIADGIIPALRHEHEEVMQELNRERAEIAEIESSDQEYLNELKTSIAEQNIEVETLQAEVADGQAQLARLQEHRIDVNSQKQEAATAIADAQRILHIQNSTRVEILKLKDELEALENLHRFRTTRVNAELFEYVHTSQFRVTIPCKNFIPIVKQVDVTRVDKIRSRSRDSFPRLSDFLLHMAKEQIAQGKSRTTRQIVHRLSDYWSSCAQLLSQLKLLTIKYPVEIEILQGSPGEHPGFKAKVTMLFPSVKAKALISFIFNARTFCYWPVTISSLHCEVEIAYGNINGESILSAVTGRLSQASPVDNYGCLLDACIEAQEIY